jgi:hypothetical protein
MKKTISIIIILLLLSINLNGASKDKLKSLIPKKIKIITQSSTQLTTQLTVIDLENNEVVILTIGGMSGDINEINRTGIICDPNTQQPVPGKDAPSSSK